MYSGPAVQPGTAMTAHGDEVRWHIAAGPFLELRMTARQRSGLGSRGRSTYALPYPPQTARRHKQKQCPPRRTNHRTLYRISFVTRSVRRTHTFSLTTSARCISHPTAAAPFGRIVSGLSHATSGAPSDRQRKTMTDSARSGPRPIPRARSPEFVICPLMREIHAFRYFWPI
jgi:hypothetical protein